MGPLGIVLAAGTGRRYGGPKAFVRGSDGRTWLERTCEVLLSGGCAEVLATVPAGPALPTAGDGVTLLPLTTNGQSASLDAALAQAIAREAATVVVMLVDLPDVGADVVRRVLEADAGPETLARATYDGRPGHPVLLGVAHLTALRAQLSGDTGANSYLSVHDVRTVECGDLATGRDVDHAPPAPPITPPS